MSQKEEKSKASPSPNPAMAFDTAHLLGMHTMAAAGLPYAPLSPFPSPYSLLGQPPPFPAMFGGLNLNPMANPLHAAALSHSLAAASLYGLPKHSGDLGSPPPPPPLIPSSSSSSSSSSKRGKSYKATSAHTPPTSSPSPSSPLVPHPSHSTASTPTFSPFDPAAMSPYLPGWALNGSAYHMTQLANQMAEAHKRSQLSANHVTESPYYRSSQPASSSSPSSSSSSTNRNKSRSSKSGSSPSHSSSNDNNNSSSNSGSSRKIPPAHQHHHENKNSHLSSPPPHIPMLNIPLSGSSSESKKSSSSSKLSLGDGLGFDPRSMITPYQLSPELAYLSQSLLLHRPDLAIPPPFLAASAAAATTTTTSSSASGGQAPTSSSSSSSVVDASLEPGQLSLSSGRKKDKGSTESVRRAKESSKAETEDRKSSQLTNGVKTSDPKKDSNSSSRSKSEHTLPSEAAANLPFDLSQSSGDHSMDNIRKKKIADQIRKRMAGSQQQDEQLQKEEQQQQNSSSDPSGLDLFASQHGLRQSDWLDYLANERNRLGKRKNSTSSQGRESQKDDGPERRLDGGLSLESSLQQQEEELKELQRKYALASASFQNSDSKDRSRSDGEASQQEKDSESGAIAEDESLSGGSDSEGSGRETPKRGVDSSDNNSPVKKRCYQTDERELVIPLEHGWNRQTVINGMGRRGIVGDVYYFAPCGKKLKTIPDVMRYLERNPNSDLGRENFSFNTKVNVGQFYEVRGGVSSSPIPLTDTEVLERIEMSRGKRARMQMLARKKREKVAREQALARQIMENKLKRKLELQEMSRRAAEQRFEKKLEKQKQKENEKKLKEDKALEKQREREQHKMLKQQERVRLQEQLRKERELRAQQIIEARNRRQQELEEMRQADTAKRNQEREMKRQQLIMLKEQERERRRQHILLIKALEQRKKQEERQNKERLREEKLNEKLKLREIRMSQRKVEMEVAQELKKPVEDMELKNRKLLPEFPRMENRMAGRPIADCLMVVEFLNNFGGALNLEKNSIPTLQSLENGLMGDSEEEVEEVMSLVMHLLRFAIDDVGVPNPKEAVTKLNQKITEMEMTDSTMSEILRIFIKARGDKQMSEWLKERPMEALNPTQKAAILAFLCNELLTSKVITSEIDKHMESINNLRRDKWIVEGQLRQLRLFQAKKFNKIHRSTMDRRQGNNSSNNSNSNNMSGGSGSGGGGADDDSIPPPGKIGGSDDEDDDKDDDEGSGNESDGSTSVTLASSSSNMPFEPVDETLTREESDKRIENLRKQHLAYRQKVFRSSLRLRAINIGQDRYKRTFWILPMTGGVFVEGMESGEPEDYKEEKERKVKKEKEEKEGSKEDKTGCVKEEVKEEGEGDSGKESKNEDEEKMATAEEVKEQDECSSSVLDEDKNCEGEKSNEEEGVREGNQDSRTEDGKSEKEEEKMPVRSNDGKNDGEKSQSCEKVLCDSSDIKMLGAKNDDNDDEDDDCLDDDSNLNNDEEEDDNEISNITGISENTSWAGSDFNDSDRSMSGLKTNMSPVLSSVKITVDMNGSNIRDSIEVISENEQSTSFQEKSFDREEKAENCHKPSPLLQKDKLHEEIDLNESETMIMDVNISSHSNGMSVDESPSKEYPSFHGGIVTNGESINLSATKKISYSEATVVNDTADRENDESKENKPDVKEGMEKEREEVVSNHLNVMKKDEMNANAAQVNGHSEESKAINGESEKGVGGEIELLSVDMTSNSIGKERVSVEESRFKGESSVCVDLSTDNYKNASLSPAILDKLPGADILRVPRIGQRDSLFSILNHSITNSIKENLEEKGTTVPASKVQTEKEKDKDKGSIKLNSASSILSSSLLFSPMSLSPSSSSLASHPSQLPSDGQKSDTKSSSCLSSSTSSQSPSVISPPISAHSSNKKYSGVKLTSSTSPNPTPRPAHSKAVNRQALPPFHPSAQVNPCLGQPPPAAHSSHTRSSSTKQPLHLSMKDLDNSPSRPSPSHHYQGQPPSFNNPALPINPYGDSSASQALSSLASFVSPPPAHQRLSQSSSSSSLLTSTPKLLTSTTTATNTTSATTASSSTFKTPSHFSIIDAVLKNEPEYSSSQLLHHAASQVRRSGESRDVSTSLSSSSPSSKMSSSRLPPLSSELSSVLLSTPTTPPSSSSSSLSLTSIHNSDSLDSTDFSNQHPMWFSLLPRTPCDELSLTRRTNNCTSPISSTSQNSNSNQLSLSSASLLLNSSSPTSSLLNSVTTSSSMSLENLLSLLQANSSFLSQEAFKQSLNILSSSPSPSPTPSSGGDNSCDFKVPQPPLDSSLNYDPWDLLRAAQGEKQLIPINKQHGWWRIFDLAQMKKVMTSTMNRGIRERNLQRAVHRYLDYAKLHVSHDSSIGESDPNLDSPSKTSGVKRKASSDKSPGASPVKKEKKEEDKEEKEETCDHPSSNSNKSESSNSQKDNGDGSETKDKEDDKSDEIKEEGKKDAGVETSSDVGEDAQQNRVKEEQDVKKEGGEEEVEKVEEETDFVPPDQEGLWSVPVMHEIEMAAVEDVEALEDRIYHASLQAKSGWKPNKDTGLKMVDRTITEINDDESYPLDAGIARLLELEANIERRYLKPPLSRSVSLNMSNLASSSNDTSSAMDLEEEEDIPPGLLLWRQAVIGSENPAQLSLCTQLLSKSISWEKSIMRVICQNCRKDDNEAELLLCDGCDKGFHTYCFKPKMENIPEGDWYCFECVTKASGTPHCGLCGNKGGRLAHCSKCPRYVHLDCLDPPLPRVPKRWQCANCLCDKVATKRSRKRKESLPTVQRITKLVVKEEPADADEFFLNDDSHSATPPPSIKEEPSSSTEVSPQKVDPNQTSLVDGNTSRSSSAPPEKKRRKRKEKEVEQKSLPATISPPLPPPPPPPTVPVPVSSPASKKKEKKPRKERKTKAEKKEEMEVKEREKEIAIATAVGERNQEKDKSKDLTLCGKLLGELEVHELGWPFLKPVNRKQFPTYKKYIKAPMDFTTIRNKLKNKGYKHRQDFAADVRLVFNNCETFNEDDSEVGQAGHNLRQHFENCWLEVFPDDAP